MGYGTGGVSVGFGFKHLALTAFVSAVIAGAFGASALWLYQKPDRDAYAQIKQVLPVNDVSMSEIIARLSLDSETSKELAALYKANVDPAVTSDINVTKGRAIMLEALVIESLKHPDPIKWLATVTDNAPYAANNFSQIEEFKKLSDDEKFHFQKYSKEIPEAVIFLKSMNSVPIGKFTEDEFLFAAQILRILKNQNNGSFVSIPSIEFFSKFIVWVTQNTYRSNSIQDLMDSKYSSAIKEIQTLQKQDKKK